VEYQLSEQAYNDFSTFLHKKLGILLGANRQYLVRSRLSALARDGHYTDFDLFLKHVTMLKDRELTDKCLELMTTNETFWFRDEYPYELLKKDILPRLHKQQSRLRIWSSACSSGQEPYSIAMVISAFKKQNPSAFSGGIEIVATDYSSKMINLATAGIYDQLALGRGLPSDLRASCFIPADNNSMQVHPDIKRMVKFQRFNLLNDYASMGKFDIIFCRNVLIYFDGNQKQHILNKFAACLPQSGVLFLGAAESISGAESHYKMTTKDTGLYYSKV
jgi:chemotaxis protein methyltransferase CheR